MLTLGCLAKSTVHSAVTRVLSKIHRFNTAVRTTGTQTERRYCFLTAADHKWPGQSFQTEKKDTRSTVSNSRLDLYLFESSYFENTFPDSLDDFKLLSLSHNRYYLKIRSAST